VRVPFIRRMTGSIIPNCRSVIGVTFVGGSAEGVSGGVRRFATVRRPTFRAGEVLGQVEELARRELIQVRDVGIQLAQEPIG